MSCSSGVNNLAQTTTAINVWGWKGENTNCYLYRSVPFTHFFFFSQPHLPLPPHLLSLVEVRTRAYVHASTDTYRSHTACYLGHKTHCLHIHVCYCQWPVMTHAIDLHHHTLQQFMSREWRGLNGKTFNRYSSFYKEQLSLITPRSPPPIALSLSHTKYK